MKRQLAVALVAMATFGCGTHRITFVKPSMQDRPSRTEVRQHSHGIGPLLVGGGGFFGILNEMSPALINYTGVVRTTDVCPDGFVEVSHQHNFGQSFLAGFISWLVIVNVIHQSDVEWRCLQGER